MKEERLYLVGYMASGKTTFGRALAERTGWNFLDLDEEVERHAGMPVANLIRLRGEEAFRRMESEVLKKTGSLTKTVIACGGGTPCYRDNMEFITLHGLSLWLVASPEKMAERILLAGDTRPLASGKSGDELLRFITSHLRSRQPYYCKADMRINADRLENETEIQQTIDNFLSSDIRTFK